MKKLLSMEVCGMLYAYRGFDSVENYKRRRSLPPVSLDMTSRLFFERILSVKKIRDLVFISKTKGKRR